MNEAIAPRGYERFTGHIGEFASESQPAWREPIRARAGAPNVVVILIDDLGFSDLGAFGSEIHTPHIDALAAHGWTFTNYRTAPMCSPARAALMTGINPHRAGFGFVAHTDPGYPGFTCELPANAPTLAESLRDGGYATFMVGKWHLTLESRLHDGAEKSSWPLQRGFDRYFGSMDGFTSLHHPHRLVRDNSVIDVREFPEGYFLTDQLVDEALGMIDDLRANDAEKPFFLYFAHTAVHGPIQAKAGDIARQRGRYRDGWNAIRERRFERQRALGVIPTHAELPTGELADKRIPDWDTLSTAEQERFARHMEAYAAAVVSVDQSVGALVDYLRTRGELDNTIVLVTSDNGGTAEGGPSGTRSYFAQFGLDTPLPKDWIHDVERPIEEIGGPRMFAHYPSGWARVSNTPFRDYKSSTYEGGVHAPLVISWPAAPARARGLRDQFVSVTDLAPTILDLVEVPRPTQWRGEPALEPDGRSVATLLADTTASGRSTQYFECVGRRGLVEGRWKLVSPVPATVADGDGSGGTWELYDLATDPTETRDVSGEHTALTRDLAERWRAEAWHNTVFPLDDGALHHSRPDTEAALAQPVTLTPFRPPLERFRSAKLTVLRSFAVEIALHADNDAAGVLFAHGDQGGGYLLALENGAPYLAYNAYGVMHRATGAPLSAGEHRLVLRVEEQEGLRWILHLEVNGFGDAELGPVPMLLGMAPFTGISVGYDYGGPVDWDLHERHRSFPFTGGSLDLVRVVPGPRSRHDRTVIQAIDEAVAAIAE